MAVDVQEQMLAWFHARLETISGYSVHVQPNYDPTARDLPALLMFVGAEDKNDDATHDYQIDLQVNVIVCVKATSGVELRRAARAARAKVLSVFPADVDLPERMNFCEFLGSDAPVLVPKGEGADAPPYGTLPMSFLLKYEESESDPYS